MEMNDLTEMFVEAAINSPRQPTAENEISAGSAPSAVKSGGDGVRMKRFAPLRDLAFLHPDHDVVVDRVVPGFACLPQNR
jgi:hypothetical protein